jgi:hypothetical protein
MNEQIFIITPRIEHRAAMMRRLPDFLNGLGKVTIIGRGRTGFTVSVPPGFDLAGNLPIDAKQSCFVERAQSFSLARA